MIIVYDSKECGTCEELDDGTVAITVDGSYLGIFISFNAWNTFVGGGYSLKEELVANPYELSTDDTDDSDDIAWDVTMTNYFGGFL